VTTLDRLLQNAREGRCLLREYWIEGATLPGREQLRLAKDLAKIKPATVERYGRRVSCEARFELRPKDRRRLVEALLAEGVPDKRIVAIVPGLSPRTFSRIRSNTGTAKSCPSNGSVEPRIRPKRNALVGPVGLDASDGGDAEAEARFRALVGGLA
jgi:hypothetical protein